MREPERAEAGDMNRLPWYGWAAISTVVVIVVVGLAWLVLDAIITVLH